ncbi:MAG: metal-dependent hydrolase [Candidatus Andersenbacteria bacterium]
MTATTHQMIALLGALFVLTLYPVSLGPVVGFLAVVAVMVGALTPDLDQPTANIWRRVLGGNTVGDIFQFFSGGHRHMTHSFLGILGIGYLLHWFIITFINAAYIPDAVVLWRAFMIGYISHPIADTLTDRGVPWLWPLRFHVRVPPGPEEVRVTSDSWVEQILVRGGVLICLVILLIDHWPTFQQLFRYA